MDQKVSWPAALLAIAVLLLLLTWSFRRAGSGSEGRISPGFQQLSPAEKQQALQEAERARMLRGAPPQQNP